MIIQKLNIRSISQFINKNTTNLEIEIYSCDDLEIVDEIESDSVYLSEYPNLSHLIFNICTESWKLRISPYNLYSPRIIIDNCKHKLFIPKNITTIKFNGHSYNRIFFGKSSQKLDHLIINMNYNNEFDKIFTNVKKLTFGDEFNSEIKSSLIGIPNKWININNGDKIYFDANNICGYDICDTVEYLTFGNKFNENIEGCIPDGVIELNFGKSFNKSLENCNKSRTGLPKNLKFLTINRDCYELNKKFITDWIDLKFI
ncbi:fnip repeat-containing protein [Moumouvirus maliensis]|nr:fnip repeat-containing protein [Moumouvirus maliensis]